MKFGVILPIWRLTTSDAFSASSRYRSWLVASSWRAVIISVTFKSCETKATTVPRESRRQLTDTSPQRIVPFGRT